MSARRTSRSDHRAERHPERGSALLAAIFILLLVAAMGTSLLWISQLETRMSVSSIDVKKSFYLAEGGLEDGRATLFAANGAGPFDDDLLAAAGPNATIDFDPANLVVTYDADGEISGFSGFGDDVPLRAATGFGDGAYIAFLTNDPEEGQATTADPNRRVMLTGIGAGPDSSLELVQAIIEPEHPLPALPPAAVTLIGETPSFQSGTSSASDWVGDDCDGATGTGVYAPIVGTTSDGAESLAEAGYYKDNNNSGPNFRAGPHGSSNGTVNETIANLADATEPTMTAHDPIDPVWTTCSDLVAVIEDLRPDADFLCEGQLSCALPDAGSFAYGPDSVLFIDADTALGGGSSGSGILVVTGRLVIQGDADWYGVILAVGKGEILRQGAGSGVISGSVLVADVAGPDGIYGNADDCTGSDDGFGESNYSVSGGGNGNITYCAQDLDAANPIESYRIVEFRQL